MDEGGKMVSMVDEQTIKVNLPSRLGYERIAMESLASFAKIVGFVSERVEDLKTAVAEACTNAIEHGNRGRPHARIIVTMNYEGGILSVSVVDEGEGIKEFPEKPDILQKTQNLRGRGIFLIKQLVDEVEFNKITSEGHMVRMIIKRRD